MDYCSNSPLVSAIMPIFERREWVESVIQCFLSQTYPNRELVIVEDGRDNISDMIPPGSGITYYHIGAERRTVGAKRNICCSRSRGEIIAHWDSDDWSAPERLEDQVIRLLDSGKSVTGYSSMRFTDGEKWWEYTSFDKSYALGTSLVYTRDYWQRHPFSQVQVSEDNIHIMPARNASDIVTADAGSMMIASVHSGNTSPRKMMNERQWKEIDPPLEKCSFIGLLGLQLNQAEAVL